MNTENSPWCSDVPPNEQGMAYTSPVVRFPNYDRSSGHPQWVMDSRKIAAALEAKYPNPPMHLDSPILPKVEAAIAKIQPAMAPVVIPRVPRKILNERSKYYFEKTRAERFGMTLDELEKSEKGGEKAYENATPHLEELAELLNETKGPYFMGDTVSYADFVVAGFFQFLRRTGEDDIFPRIMQIDPSFPMLYEACGGWLQRDSY